MVGAGRAHGGDVAPSRAEFVRTHAERGFRQSRKANAAPWEMHGVARAGRAGSLRARACPQGTVKTSGGR